MKCSSCGREIKEDFIDFSIWKSGKRKNLYITNVGYAINSEKKDKKMRDKILSKFNIETDKNVYVLCCCCYYKKISSSCLKKKRISSYSKLLYEKKCKLLCGESAEGKQRWAKRIARTSNIRAWCGI